LSTTTWPTFSHTFVTGQDTLRLHARGLAPSCPFAPRARGRADQGHAAPQVTTVPPGQTVGSPAAQRSKAQPCSPARPALHSSTQLEPAAQVAAQLSSRQVKRHALRGPHAQVPFAHSPSQLTWSPSHCTWHGPESQLKSQLAPRSQAQVPLAQVPLHAALPAQVTWQGGLWQKNAQAESSPHRQEPLPHSAVQAVSSPWHSTWQGGAPHGISQCSPRSQ
jgi:hypothetical protein